MNEYLLILNAIFVLFYGLALSFSFTGITYRNAPRLCCFSLLGLLLALAVSFLLFGEITVEKMYPILIHLPIIFILRFVAKSRWIISISNVILAYLLCTPRLWIGSLVALFYSNNQDVSYLVQCLVTIPLLWIITRFLTPHVRNLAEQDFKILASFISLPTCYYIFTFWVTIYSDWYYTKQLVLLEFMDILLVLIYTAFLFFFMKVLEEKQRTESLYHISEMMNKQAHVELATLRTIQEKDAIYRHDLRHHLSYLKSSILAQNMGETLQYIQQLSEQLDDVVLYQYCENENINLILSSYITQAKEADIETTIEITTLSFPHFSSLDICSLLSNALENAIIANSHVTDISRKHLSLRLFNKNNYLCIEVQNAYHTAPIFESGIPTTNREYHGYGIKSMINIVEKYKGTYSFSTTADTFIFQAMLLHP